VDRQPTQSGSESSASHGSVRRRIPGAVTAVSALLWLSAIAAVALAVVFLMEAGDLDDSALKLLAGLSGLAAIVSALCAVMIRRGSRGWRNVTVALCALSIASALYRLPVGVTAILVNATAIYLLLGTESSRRFFEGSATHRS
jgi:chromate transport protein ChrA